VADIPRKLGRYEIERELGRGSMGTVYLGHDPFNERQVAIKVCDTRAGDDSEGSKLSRRLFFNEAHTVGLLKHPNIVEMQDAAFDDDGYFIVMEHVPGGRTLADYCRIDNLLPVDKAVEIGFKCAAALDYAHRQGVVHQDVKPSNILLTEDLEPKIGDFGVARIANLETTEVMGVAGTPQYMSPEQASDKEITNVSDLYSLGVVLYELLTGRQAYTAQNIGTMLFKILNESPAPPSTFRHGVPPLVDRVVGRMLAKDPAERYQMGLDVAGDLSIAVDRLKAPSEEIGDAERFRLTRALRFFKDFTDAEVWEFVRASQWRRLEAKQKIVADGDFDDAVYILAAGRADAVKRGKVLTHLVPGDCIGEIGYITRAERTADVITRGEAMVIRVNARMLDRASPALQLRFNKVFLRTMIERVVHLSDQLSRVKG